MTRPGHHEWNKNFWSFFVRCLVESVTHGWSIVTTRIKASGGHCARQGCSIHLVSTARLSDLGSRRMLKENSLRDYYTKGKGMRLFVSLRCEIKIFGLYVMQPVWFSCCRGRTPPPLTFSQFDRSVDTGDSIAVQPKTSIPQLWVPSNEKSLLSSASDKFQRDMILKQ